MARKPRFILPGIPQHVIQRGHNREPCFYSEDDNRRYLENLHDAAKSNSVAIHAYILMTNHVHLLVTPGHAHGITHMMQDTGRKYVRYINRTYKRTGSLWEGRYKASLVDSEAYLLTCMRYIEMNPVRAGMVKHPGDYRWSSYHSNAGFKNNLMIESHPVYKRLANSVEQRQHAYRELFNKDLDQEDLHAIREVLNQELVLGREDFKDKIEQMTRRQTRPGESGRPKIEDGRAIYYVI
ncbi:MAG: transposase [Gammaproteobacteria bacterium]|nr:transposase [Gammaproteobacteria bacterium]MCW8924218.1 transposase [Gammaproteobacteria bacterium]